jgi:hypothetical protein
VRRLEAEDRANPTSDSGIRTVDVGFARGEHGDAGDRIAVTAAQRRNPMYALNDHAPSSRSVPMRFLVRSWEYRRPRLWVRVRVACGIFNVALGVLLLASVRWLGPLAWLAALPLAGAALIFWTAHRLQASVRS